jgi:hypothetical protein
MLLPQAASEIKLLSDLLDKELEVALRTGDMKTVPQKLEIDPKEGIVSSPVEAFRVVLAYRRLQKKLQEHAQLGETPTDQAALPPGTLTSEEADGGEAREGERAGPEAVLHAVRAGCGDQRLLPPLLYADAGSAGHPRAGRDDLHRVRGHDPGVSRATLLQGP